MSCVFDSQMMIIMGVIGLVIVGILVCKYSGSDGRPSDPINGWPNEAS